MSKNKNKYPPQNRPVPPPQQTQPEAHHEDPSRDQDLDQVEDQEDEPEAPEPTGKGIVITSTVLHCGMPIQVLDFRKKVFCNGCHAWVMVAKCETVAVQK